MHLEKLNLKMFEIFYENLAFESYIQKTSKKLREDSVSVSKLNNFSFFSFSFQFQLETETDFKNGPFFQFQCMHAS